MVEALRNPARKSLVWLVILGGALAVYGCGGNPSDGGPTENDVVASVINVTPFEVEAVISGVLDDSVDTVERTVGPSDSADTIFVCIDQLVVGDPLDPSLPGVTAMIDGETVGIEPFSVFAGESFACGDIVEIIISGVGAESLAVDVFSLTPP